MLRPSEYFEPLPAEDRDAEFIAMESRSFARNVWDSFSRNRLALIGLLCLAAMVLAAAFGPMLSPYPYDGMDAVNRNLGSSVAHWFGTDQMGRDIFTRVLYGTRVSLLVGFASTALNLVIGVLYGGIAGYVGGRTDMIMMRVVDVIYAVPAMIYMILLMLIFGSNIYSVMLGICVNGWINMARIVRSQVMALKEQEFAVAAFVIGADRRRILFRHLLLNCLGPVIVTVTLMIPQAIFTEAFLSFIGIGISAPMASLGTLAQDARMLMNVYPMQMVWPVLVICVVIFSLNFIGEGLETALNPKRPEARGGSKPAPKAAADSRHRESGAAQSEAISAGRLLDVNHLCVTFGTRQGEVRAVRDVSFHVDRGEILGFVGESGSGKSVSVMSCLGLIAKNGSVADGSIRFDGRELSPAGRISRAEKRMHEAMLRDIRGNEISMIFQDPMTYMNPVLTVGTQLTEGIIEHAKCSKREAWQRGIELLRQVGIPSPEKRMRQYPYEFSGGMRQRIIIAAALACNPKLLIADEPTTALDVTVQAQILELIRRRAREDGTSVIMITHDLGVVASLCDRIAILYGGKIVETGTADEIFYETKHPYTRGLLNSISRRQARPDGSFSRGTLASIPGTPPDLLKINAGCPLASRCPDAMRICRDYAPSETAFNAGHTAACWLYCRERAGAIVEETDGRRGESRG